MNQGPVPQGEMEVVEMNVNQKYVVLVCISVAGCSRTQQHCQYFL